MRRAVCGMRHAACGVQHAACGLQIKSNNQIKVKAYEE
jgi:hypothetical protein